jgi:hypothetical protein
VRLIGFGEFHTFLQPGDHLLLQFLNLLFVHDA